MYMVKRVFKNKRLIRNILILAVLLFIGFFVWRAFFSGSKDGFQTKGKHSLNKLEIACTEETKNTDTESKAVLIGLFLSFIAVFIQLLFFSYILLLHLIICLAMFMSLLPTRIIKIGDN